MVATGGYLFSDFILSFHFSDFIFQRIWKLKMAIKCSPGWMSFSLFIGWTEPFLRRWKKICMFPATFWKGFFFIGRSHYRKHEYIFLCLSIFLWIDPSRGWSQNWLIWCLVFRPMAIASHGLIKFGQVVLLFLFLLLLFCKGTNGWFFSRSGLNRSITGSYQML